MNEKTSESEKEDNLCAIVMNVNAALQWFVRFLKRQTDEGRTVGQTKAQNDDGETTEEKNPRRGLNISVWESMRPNFCALVGIACVFRGQSEMTTSKREKPSIDRH